MAAPNPPPRSAWVLLALLAAEGHSLTPVQLQKCLFLLGIRRSDGIVLGADGSATLGALGTYTARQQSVKKLRIVREKIVFGLSGPVGLGQLLCACVEVADGQGALGGRVEQVAEYLRG